MRFWPFSRRRAALAGAGIALLGVGLVLLAHAPFVRRAALVRILPAVEQAFNLRLEASRLDYSLVTLRIGLADVALSRPDMASEPFFTAEYLSVVLPWRALIGEIAFRDIAVTNANVLVRRWENGTTNLPESQEPTETPDGEPTPLLVDRLAIPQIAIDIRDEQVPFVVWVPAATLLLDGDNGYVRLVREAQVSTDTQSTVVSTLDGRAAFDGRVLRLSALRIDSPEIDAEVDGSLAIIAREQTVETRVRGNADLTQVARWAIANGDLPRGDVAFDARIAGPFDALTTEAELSSKAIAWRDAAVEDVSARIAATSRELEIADVRLAFAGGRATASGIVPLAEDGKGQVTASWTGVDLPSATRSFAPDVEMLPAGRMSGDLRAEGVGLDPDAWSGSLNAVLAGGANARSRVAIDGKAAVRFMNRSWNLEATNRLADAAPVNLSLRGDQDGAIDGSVAVGETDVARLTAALNETGLAAIPAEALSSGLLQASLRVSGSVDDPVIDGEAVLQNLEGSQLRAASVSAGFSGRPAQPEIAFELDSPEVVVSDQPLAEVHATGRVTGTALVIDGLTARQPATAGTLSADGTYDFQGARYAASLSGSDWQLMNPAGQPISGTLALEFAGEGTLEEPRGRGTAVLRQGLWEEMTLGDITAAVVLDGTAADIDADAPAFGATAKARVALDAPYQTVADVRVDRLQLERVLEQIELPTSLSGTTTATVHAEGPLENWRSGSASIEVAELDATADNLVVRLREPARLRYADGNAYVDRVEAAAGDLAISAAGILPAFEPSGAAPGVLVTAVGDVDAVARAAAATGLTDLPVTSGEGPVALLARVTGALQAPVIAADLEVGPASIALEDLPSVTDLRLRAHAEDGWIELREAAASFEQAAVTATGRAPLALFSSPADPVPGAATGSGGTAELHARATNLTPSVLAAFVEPGTLDELAGSVDVTLDAATPTLELADLVGELRIDRFDVRVADLPITQKVPTRIVARDGFARVEAWEWIGQGASLAVRGQVRLEDRQAAILANGLVDLRVLTPFVRDAGLSTTGTLEPRLSITGSIDNPRVDGDIVITDGEMRLVDPRVVVSDLTVRTVLSRTTARITQLTGSVNGGTLTGDGEIEYDPQQGVAGQITTQIAGMAMNFPEGLRSEVDADLALSIQSTPAEGRPSTDPGFKGRLSGTVTVLRGAYREPMAVVTGLLAGLRAQTLATGEASPALDALALDVRVLTEEDILVDNNYGRFQLGGDLRLIGTASAPSLSGRAELREDGQLFVGRNVYTITSGTMDFSNPVVIEPDLDLDLRTEAGGHEIQVTITGTPEMLMTQQRSLTDPDLGQADVVSLLLTGRPLDELAPGDAAFVGTQVLGNLSADALGFASRAVGLDTLRLGGVDTTQTTIRRDPTAVATELDPTTRLTFGKSLGSDVDVTFSQSLRDSDAQTWIVDYLAAPGFELRLVSNDDDLRSYGFRHDVSFGGGRVSGTSRPSTERPEAPRVADVQIGGDLVLPEERVRGVLRLEAGERFDFAAWQDDRDRLEALYWSEQRLTPRIVARRADTPEGVGLTYDIVAGPETTIEATGVELSGDVRSRLETAWSQAIFDDFLVDEATRIIREDLAQRGYLAPVVQASVRDEGARKVLQLAIEMGARTTRTLVRVEGASEELAAEIEEQLAAGGLVDRAVVDPGAVREAVTGYLRTQGYLRAQVTIGAPLFEGEIATVPIEVSAGPPFLIAAIVFQGRDLVSEETLLTAAGLKVGMAYDPGAVDAARDRVLATIRREGFAVATVAVRPVVREDASTADVVFAIEEGPRQVVREVVVAGTRAIDPDVVTRALDLPIDAPLRTEDLLQARTRVFDTGLFRRIDVLSEPLESGADERIAPMRLRVTVEEWPAARLRYGVVAAEERPEDRLEGRELVPGFAGDITRRTLFGRAVAVGGAFEIQRRDRGGRVFVSAPTMLGAPIESSVLFDTSRRELIGTNRTDTRRGASFEQRFRLASRLQLSYAYKFERSVTELPPDPFLGPLPPIVLNVARLTGTAAWDTRDDPADTMRGLLAASTFELAPSTLGSDIRFVRELAQAYYFRPFGPAVLASAARFGVAIPLDDQDLLFSERFFSGGSRSVRGVDEGGLGGRDFFDEPTGGEAMIVLNQEARVPLYKWLRGVAFIDAGNVFGNYRDARVTDLVGSVGFGLRLATPFALLRVDYGRTVWGVSEKGARWTFGVGQAF